MRFALNILHTLTGDFFKLQKFNRIILRKIACLEENQPEATYGDRVKPLLSASVLIGYLDQEQARRRVIEDKAKINALAITLAFSAMLAGVALASRLAGAREISPDWLVWFVMVPQIAGIGFLLVGGLLALGALRVAKMHMWTLAHDQRNMTDEEKNVKISWYLEINQNITILKSNQVDTSYICIRNGVIALAVAALIAVFVSLSPPILATQGCCCPAIVST